MEPGNPRTVARCIEDCLRIKRETTRSSTVARYEELARLHVLPVLGPITVTDLQGAVIREWAMAALTKGLSRSTVRQAVCLLRNSLDLAVEQGLVTANPAGRVANQLRLSSRKFTNGDAKEIYYIPPEHVAWILDYAKGHHKGIYPLLLALHRSGIRLGEARALQWGDVDFSPGKRSLHIQRTFSKSEIHPPKGGRPREVDMSAMLSRTLFEMKAKAKGPWVFASRTGTPFGESNVERAFHWALQGLKLPDRYRLHDLRHSFAIDILRAGKSLIYVRDQLGHADIQVTANFYGRFTRMRDLSAVDHLDNLVGARQYEFVGRTA